MTVAQPSRIKWRKRRKPTHAVAEFIERVPYAVAESYIQQVKRKAGGRLRTNRGRRWPVDRGYSRDRFALEQRRARVSGREKARPSPTITIEGARYAPFVDRKGGGILDRLWRRFGKGRVRRQAEVKVARKLDRMR